MIAYEIKTSASGQVNISQKAAYKKAFGDFRLVNSEYKLSGGEVVPNPRFQGLSKLIKLLGVGGVVYSALTHDAEAAEQKVRAAYNIYLRTTDPQQRVAQKFELLNAIVAYLNDSTGGALDDEFKLAQGLAQREALKDLLEKGYEVEDILSMLGLND